MRVDPTPFLRRGEELVAGHAATLPVAAISRGLRVSTQLRTTRFAGGEPTIGGSRFGGLPDLPASVDWPRWEGFVAEDLVLANGRRIPRGKRPASLSFLAQLDLATIPDGTGLLPESGLLSFFFDAVQHPPGFDPRSRGGARVLYTEAGVALAQRPVPEDVRDATFHATALTPELTATLPRWASSLNLELEKPAAAVYWELAEQWVAGPEPHHRLLGWPKEVQGDMALQCQLVTNGIYCGTPEGYCSAEAERLKSGADDWLMLLQLDTDEEGPGWMWGDAGCLYFWIRKQDLAARRFEEVWAIMQCY